MRQLSLPLAALALAVAGFEPTASAQCALGSSSSGPQPHLSGYPDCSALWDPDGTGPAATLLVIGGSQLTAGSQGNRTLMTWDGSAWQGAPNPGSHPQTSIRALTVWNGALVASGTIFMGGGQGIASWNGSSWQPVGTPLPENIGELTTWNGDLVAATTSSPIVIRRWDGVAWTALPTPPSLTQMATMVPFQGLLCVGGQNTFGQGVLERWNGTSWSPSILASGPIRALKVRSFSLLSSLYVGGSFTSIGGVAASHIASTSGGTSFPFSAVGGGLPAECNALHVRATSALGTVVVAGTSSSTTVLQLVAGVWTPMGQAPASEILYHNGSYFARGAGTGESCSQYDGAAWVPVRGPGTDGEVRASTRVGDDVVVGGTFSTTPSGTASRIARWDGTSWSPLGAGVIGSSVDALLTLGNGDVVAGGLFSSAGGVAANDIARWNGSTWSSLGTGANQQVLALAKLPNGDVVAGGKFTTAGGVSCQRIARWNGTAWAPLGTGMNGDVNALAVRGDGTLFVGGAFTLAGGVACSRIAMWNGTQWLPLGTGCNNDVLGLATRPNGDVVAVGAFTSAGGSSADRCARWTGSAWAAMGTSSINTSLVHAVLALPNGDVVVGHGFHTPTPFQDEGLSRWNGSTWSGIATLSAHPLCCIANTFAVRTLTQRADGDVVVGGRFGIANGTVSHNLASIASACMPLAQAYGAGCSSAAGPLVLGAETLPWIGATFRTATTGIAPLSLCLGAIGFSQVSIPLPSLLAQGQPGCTLLASPDMLDVVIPDGTGTARTALALANSPSLLGGVFFQQSIPLEFNPAGAIVAIRGSNGLALTIGTL